MKYNAETDSLVFTCLCCEDDMSDCHSCNREKSAYECGYYAGIHNLPSDNTFSGNESEAYAFGYRKGNME